MSQEETVIRRSKAVERILSDRDLERPTDSKIVMAEQSTRDVVDKVPSVGDASLADAHATQSNIVQPTEVTGEQAAATDPSTAGVASIPSDSLPTHGQAAKAARTTAEVDPLKAQSIEQSGVRLQGPSLPQTAANFGQSALDVPAKVTTKVTKQASSGTGSNGEKQALTVAEPTTEQATLAAEASGGSDTDVNKVDGNKGHLRTNSMKKPASFKAVSVTRNFLAKAVAGSSPPSMKLGNKGSFASSSLDVTRLDPTDNKMLAGTFSAGSAAADQPPARPRLVAKSGSGLRDAGPRLSATPTGTGSTATPDASQVWNKNRPTLPAPPKQFTDEELKQQYGIHLATRLRADADDKESKWADIDDDDDDWQPETIEWNDGTKITLPHHDDPPVVEVIPAQVEQPAAVEAASRPTVATPTPMASLAPSLPPKTGLTALGGNRTGGGLVLKGALEKPVLVAKPPVPTPVKSPWATLPPMEKMPPLPVPGPPSQHQQASRFMQNDPHGFDAMPTPTPQATEIAADDFSRTWRDSNSGGSRELFNSHSGRYEPVNDARRGPPRPHDSQNRPPSVLQRSSQHDASGPAEPSAAFQTHRSGTQDEPYGRRRTSSNVSGGSGHPGRRMSSNRGHGPDGHGPFHGDPISQRRGSQAVVSEHSESDRVMSPSDMHRRPGPGSPMTQHQAHHRESPVLHHAQSQSPQDTRSARPQPSQGPPPSQPTQAPPAMLEDPLEMQKKIMRESRELAMKRRREQEEREEAEKKERIRLKMEALGMPPPGGKDRKKEIQPVEVLKHVELQSGGPSQRLSDEIAKPPTGFAAGSQDQSKKYESLKLQPKTITTQAPLQDRSPSIQKLPPTGATRPEAQDPTSRMANGARVDAATTGAHLDRTREGAAKAPEPQPWKNVPSGPDTYTSWGGAGMTTHSAPGGNLWGPPSHDKALGNGTFNQGYGRLPSRQAPLPPNGPSMPLSGPGPIGPPILSQRPMGPPVSPHLAGVRPVSMGSHPHPHPHHHPMSMSPPPQASAMHLNHVGPGQPSNLSDQLPMSRPGPIGRPIGVPGGIGLSEGQRSQAVNAWKALPAQLAQQESEEQQRHARAYALQLKEEDARVGRPEPTFKETWRQVAVDTGASGARQVVGISRTVNGVAVEEVGTQPLSGPAMTPPPAVMGTTSAPGSVRGSRFFPPSVVSGQAKAGSPSGHAVPNTHDSSSPPPDSSAHPAYDGDISNPHVVLPSPRPVVKLPPMMVQVMAAARALAPPPASTTTTIQASETSHPPMTTQTRPVVPNRQDTWQDRIHGLLHSRKPSSPQKSNSTIAVTSATKAPLEGQHLRSSATVSLPRSEDGSVGPETEEIGEPTTRATEEALLEEREFGSLPIVHLPTCAPPNAWQPARTPSSTRVKARSLKAVQVLSIDALVFRAKESGQGTLIEVLLPGMLSRKTAWRPHPTGIPRGGYSNGGWKGKPRGTKSRDSSGNYSGPQRGSSHGAPSTGQVNGPSRGGFQSGNWATRLSGTAH